MDPTTIVEITFFFKLLTYPVQLSPNKISFQLWTFLPPLVPIGAEVLIDSTTPYGTTATIYSNTLENFLAILQDLQIAAKYQVMDPQGQKSDGYLYPFVGSHTKYQYLYNLAIAAETKTATTYVDATGTSSAKLTYNITMKLEAIMPPPPPPPPPPEIQQNIQGEIVELNQIANNIAQETAALIQGRTRILGQEPMQTEEQKRYFVPTEPAETVQNARTYWDMDDGREIMINTSTGKLSLANGGELHIPNPDSFNLGAWKPDFKKNTPKEIMGNYQKYFHLPKYLTDDKSGYLSTKAWGKFSRTLMGMKDSDALGILKELLKTDKPTEYAHDIFEFLSSGAPLQALTLLLPFAIPGVSTITRLGTPFFYLMLDALNYIGPLPTSLDAVRTLLTTLYSQVPEQMQQLLQGDYRVIRNAVDVHRFMARQNPNYVPDPQSFNEITSFLNTLFGQKLSDYLKYGAITSAGAMVLYTLGKKVYDNFHIHDIATYDQHQEHKDALLTILSAYLNPQTYKEKQIAKNLDMFLGNMDDYDPYSLADPQHQLQDKLYALQENTEKVTMLVERTIHQIKDTGVYNPFKMIYGGESLTSIIEPIRTIQERPAIGIEDTSQLIYMHPKLIFEGYNTYNKHSGTDDKTWFQPIYGDYNKVFAVENAIANSFHPATIIDQGVKYNKISHKLEDVVNKAEQQRFRGKHRTHTPFYVDEFTPKGYDKFILQPQQISIKDAFMLTGKLVDQMTMVQALEEQNRLFGQDEDSDSEDEQEPQEYEKNRKRQHLFPALDIKLPSRSITKTMQKQQRTKKKKKGRPKKQRNCRIMIIRDQQGRFTKVLRCEGSKDKVLEQL